MQADTPWTLEAPHLRAVLWAKCSGTWEPFQCHTFAFWAGGKQGQPVQAAPCLPCQHSSPSFQAQGSGLFLAPKETIVKRSLLSSSFGFVCGVAFWETLGDGKTAPQRRELGRTTA